MTDLVSESPGEVADAASTRAVSIGSMPLWRKRELAIGILRGAVRHGLAGYNRLPIIHRDVKVRRSNGDILIGHLSEIHDRVVLSAIGEPAGSKALISIGDRTSIWYGTVISARHEIRIGNHCAISWNCTVIDDDMHQIAGLSEPNEFASRRHTVTISDHVWIGASAIVLKGVTIGANSIVAAGSIVTKDVPSCVLVAGAPARVIRNVTGWK